jgi:hypothetical protein
MTAATTPILYDVLRRESRSLLQYMEEAFPWTPAQEKPAWEKLQKLIAEERKALTVLATFLSRRHIQLPYIGSFPEPFTALNFSSLDYLLPRLLEEQRKSIAALEREVALLQDPDAAAVVRQLLDVKQRHLPTLEGLASRPQASTSA